MPKIDYDKLLQRVAIDEVAKRLGMELRQETATRAKSLCPFHDDKTPSLLIDSSRDQGRQHFHCFACGAHGDAIDLVKKQLGLGFREAVDWLEPGSLAETGRKSFRNVRPNKPDIDRHTGLELGYQLYKGSTTNAKFQAWAAERQLDEVVLCRAGFVHADENFLCGRLAAEQDASEQREQAGLLEDANLIRRLFPGVAPALHLPLNEGSGAVNRYRDSFIGERIVFPLYDDKKQLLGLGSRAVGAAIAPASPKYQFSQGFPKATVLYRADHAFQLVRDEAKQGKKDIALYLCEGFLDALRFEGLGLPAVAVMGSSISEQQVRLLHTLSDGLPTKDATLTVVVCFDRDEAGLRGAADACLKLIHAPVECRFLWPTSMQLATEWYVSADSKDPNDYLQKITGNEVVQRLASATYSPVLAVLANAFGVSAEDTLNNVSWEAAPRSRRYRAFSRVLNLIKKVTGGKAEAFLRSPSLISTEPSLVAALAELMNFACKAEEDASRSLSEDFLNDAQARLNHARILAYMGSRRGELPCDEPRWERLDIAATAFNTFLVDRLSSAHKEPLGSYEAVWVPRSFGGADPRLKMMPQAEDLIVQQYLLNEVLTERWDHRSIADPFSRMIPAVRYYREERRTVTTGFDTRGDGRGGELGSRTLSFAYQLDMDVLEGRQPASDQGMYRPFSDCWRDFMKSVAKQASEIGYVHSIRLDVKRYYDRLRRYVVRDRLLGKLQSAIDSVTGETPGFAELLSFGGTQPNANSKAAHILDHMDEQLFGVSYKMPDTGLEADTDALVGIPQGPVLSAWIGSVALFPVDEEAYRFMERYNTDRARVGYARYVDDIVLLADDQSTLMLMRDAIDRTVRKLELTLVPKADEIPAMSAEEFSVYINQGRALAASGPAWEPPLVGDGESGWDFWSIAPSTDRQSALQLLHNVELYKASPATLLQTVKTAFQASDLRASELSKGARLIWYSIACDQTEVVPGNPTSIWDKYLHVWNECMQGSPWRLQPEKYSWESPILFALEGLEHLLDTTSRDVAELSASENVLRRQRITWLANLTLSKEFSPEALDVPVAPTAQLGARLSLIRWKANRVVGQHVGNSVRLPAERSRLVQRWHSFEWLHEAVAILSAPQLPGEDPLLPFVGPTTEQVRQGSMSGISAEVFKALLPESEQQPGMMENLSAPHALSTAAGVALQTLVSVVPRLQLLNLLGRRPQLAWGGSATSALNRLTLPPLPGVRAEKLFSCLSDEKDVSGLVMASGLEVIAFSSNEGHLAPPNFLGADGSGATRQLMPLWQAVPISGTDGALLRLNVSLTKADYLRLREHTQVSNQDVTSEMLKNAASLFRAIAQVVMAYSQSNDDKELIPAWPYIATETSGPFHYLIADGVSRFEIGNRAFVRDGGRALRTIEVPIYEASLWRVGVAISDYLGLHDDVAKFSTAEHDVTLNAAALANPARYVLRAQLRKLRGAYADSQIGKRRSHHDSLPTSVERALKLLETFPPDSNGPLAALVHVLTSEAESAAMYLAFRERWESPDISAFLTALTVRVIARLPLSIGQMLAPEERLGGGLRRDFEGLLCFARKLFALDASAELSTLPAWNALRAGIVATGISVALDGLLASLRSHSDFERYENFDFPSAWEIPAVVYPIDNQDATTADPVNSHSRPNSRNRLLEQLRRVVQHLGHRLNYEISASRELSDELVGRLREIVITVAQVEVDAIDENSLLEWPFGALSNSRLSALNLNLLEAAGELVKRIDQEIGFEVLLVVEQSYGYNAQTKRFTDSRNGVHDVTPWMISQFPRQSRHIEEVSFDGRFLRVWSEVFDRQTGKLLSVSALGEPFASFAINKPELNTAALTPSVDPGSTIISSTSIGPMPYSAPTEAGSAPESIVVQPRVIDRDVPEPPKGPLDKDSSTAGVDDGETGRAAHAFRKQQIEQWGLRGGTCRQDGHVRVALLQADLDLTYRHPFVEACPSTWPFNAAACAEIAEQLKGHSTYGHLFSAAEKVESAHLWTGVKGATPSLPSWAEHRRRSILRRVVDSCEAFGVDLLVLPEYSVRHETIGWLKTYLANKSLAVLAGTYMDVRRDPGVEALSAPITLLWPLPKEVSALLATGLRKRDGVDDKVIDSLRRGHVLEFARNKKYRSIALEEFFRPAVGRLGPLFEPSQLAKTLEKLLNCGVPSDALIHLLSATRLPLKHLLELICSEIFLVSSPANYLHMKSDLQAIRRRFGEGTEDDEIFEDVKALSKLLYITGNGIGSRRSILAVPAATSRSADYWIAGQAGFLAAGTTTVFCNCVDGKALVGGSCFIGQGSWKTEDGSIGMISKINPYQSWSKGVFYNNRNDALSNRDQAVVIADIDPHNMLEGKPRAQTMPAPLQLVAYLPLVETINWSETEVSLLGELGIPITARIKGTADKKKISAKDHNKFWSTVLKLQTETKKNDLDDLWAMFSDEKALASRASAYFNNGDMQPTSSRGQGLFISPAYYDWIDVSLSLNSQQELPKISTPPWKKN
jgi:hypothetical protein